MGCGPFGSPWQVAESGKGKPLTLEIIFDEFLQIYDLLNQSHGLSPLDVKELELWEIGGLLRKISERAERVVEEDPETGHSIQKPKRNLIAERLQYEEQRKAWIAGGQLGPEPQPPQPDEVTPDAGLTKIMALTEKG